jgi:AcrR family transcriptional regulator
MNARNPGKLARSAVSEPPPTDARWRRRKEARPQEILEAALAVFAEKGFAAARMDDIAARAGVTKGTIYLYFDGKEALFKALLQETADTRIAEFLALASAHDGPIGLFIAQLLKGIGTFVATTDRAVLPKIVIAEAGNFPELARFHHDIVISRVLGFITSLIEKGQARGEFRMMPAGHAARLLLAPIPFIVIWRTTFAQFEAQPYDYAGLIDAHVETFLKGIAA